MVMKNFAEKNPAAANTTGAILSGKNDSDLKRAVLYFFIYCPLGIICPLIGQYLSSIGFSGTQVGVVTSLGTGTAILAGLFWGKVYSNSSRKRMILAGMCLGAAAMGIVSMTTEVFALYALVYSAMYFFQGPVYGVSDAFILSKSRRFSAIRATGAFGFAAAVFIAGQYAESYGLKNIFYMYAATFAAAAVITLTESEPPYYKEENEKIRMGELFKNKKFVKLLISVFFLMGTSVANNTYFGYPFKEQGGDVAGIGLAFLLMAGSEAPFMALTPKLSQKLGSERLLLAAMFLTVARFGFYATGPSCTVLLSTFFLQGMTNGIILVEVVKYFGKIAGDRLSNMAISVFYAVGNNMSVIVCTFLGGVILDVAGPKTVYLFFALFNSIAVILFIALGMYKREIKQ